MLDTLAEPTQMGEGSVVRGRVAVVVPAYRVASHIAEVIGGIPDYVSHIIVVDDASADETADMVRSVHDSRVVLVQHQHNQGVGGAVLTGYLEALRLGADAVVKIDGDGQMDPRYMRKLLGPVLSGKADYAKGNRFVHIRELRQMPLVRRIGNMGLSFMAKAASGYWDVFDPTNGYTAVHTRTLELMDLAALDRRWFFETSMLLELGLVRAVVKDVYMPAKYAAEQSSLSELHALLHFPFRLSRALLKRFWIQYFVKEFSPVALFLMVGLVSFGFGIVWGVYHWLEAFVTHTEAPTGTVMLAVLPTILGVQFLLQALVLDIQNAPKQPLSHGEPEIEP
jgi:dolichol-phosphate mannosyltransferase